MTYKIYIRNYKPTSLGVGKINMEKGHKALAMDEKGQSILPRGVLERPHVDFMSKCGIMISGFEEINNNKHAYQEWWLEYIK